MTEPYKKFLKRQAILYRVGKPYRRIPKRVAMQKMRKRHLSYSRMMKRLSGGKGYAPEKFIKVVKERKKEL